MNAESSVYDILAYSKSNAQSMMNEAMSLFSAWGGAYIDAPDVSLSDAPGAPSMPSMPNAPNIQDVSIGVPVKPTTPALAEFELPDVEIPNWTVDDPNVVLPDAPEFRLPDDPGGAPEVQDLTLPDAPVLDLPDPPDFDAVEIPQLPGGITPNFDGDRPPLPPMDTPGNVFVWEEGRFSSPVWEAVQGQLVDELLQGGDVSRILGMSEIVAQEAHRIEEARDRKKEEAGNLYANLNYARPPDFLLKQWRLIDRDAERDLETLYAQVRGKQFELSMQHRQWAVQQGLACAELAMNLHNQVSARGLEAAKTAAQFAYQDLDARVALYNLRLAFYQADAAVFEAKIRASQAKLEEYRTAMEGARIRGELRRQDLDWYLAQIQAVGQKIEIYKSQMQGAATAMEVQRIRLQAYESRIQGYVARVNAETAKANLYNAQIAGQKALVEVYSERAKAHGLLVDAAKVQADIGKTSAEMVETGNRNLVSLFQANVQAYQAEIQQMAAEGDLAVKTAESRVKAYEASVKGASAEGENIRQLHVAEVQKWAQRLDIALRAAGLHLDWGKSKVQLNVEAMRAAAQVAAQMAASLMSQVHASANVGFSESQGKSVTESTSKSEITSKSTSETTSHGSSSSDVTTHNYNYSA